MIHLVLAADENPLLEVFQPLQSCWAECTQNARRMHIVIQREQVNKLTLSCSVRSRRFIAVSAR